MKPQRIQRKRTKGWRMPSNTVYVGRPGKYYNPFKMSDGLSREQAVKYHRQWLIDRIMLRPERLEELQADLRGKNLACWCRLDQLCHADILLKLANEIQFEKMQYRSEKDMAAAMSQNQARQVIAILQSRGFAVEYGQIQNSDPLPRDLPDKDRQGFDASLRNAVMRVRQG